jgi:hypothetical protein
MSLVGSLEDLGLGDILQIIHLSRKSGTLWIRSTQGEGQIVFSAGLICGAFTKDGPSELRDLLLAKNALPPEAVDSSSEEARSRGKALSAVLVERNQMTGEAIEELRRGHVEACVIRMFTWLAGEFSFEIRENADDSGEDLFVAGGMNPQFLALEGTRLHDEAKHGGDPEVDDELLGEDGIAFGHEAEDEDAAQKDDAPLLVAEEVDDDEPILAAPIAEPEVSPEPAPPPAAAAAREAAVAVAPAAAADPAARRTVTAPTAVVAIDHDLASLEWLKAALAPAHPRVHIFQRSDQGIARIRQYLARGDTPLVVLSAEAPADPVSGARDAAEIIRRLKLQAPRMPVFLAQRAGDALIEVGADGTLVKPNPTQLADPRCAGDRQQLALALGDSLREQLARGGAPAAPTAPRRDGGMSPEQLARLRAASARLRDPGSKGDVLSLALRFAGESFARVAIFMVRDEQAIGIAQLGLPKAGGPGDASISEVVVPHREPAWFRRVLDGRNAIRGAPGDEGDQRLAVLLGNTIPTEAYVAPIESGERVIALLYADNLPGGEPLGDTAALEVLLHEAGMALDRAVLERALAEAEGA